MKNISIILLALFVVSACQISFSDPSFDDQAATKVSLALTQTVQALEIDQQVKETTSAADNPSDDEEKTPTETPLPDFDPAKDLGAPTWSDNLDSGEYWSVESGPVKIDTTTISHENGKLVIEASAVGKGNNWWLTYLKFKDAYLEGEFSAENCSGDDQYGLVFRAPDYNSGFSYYFHVTCDGRYDLRRWNGSGSSMLLGMPSSNMINEGPGEINKLGVWIKGNVIRLYVNGIKVDELTDDGLTGEGHFGVFINAKQTSGLKIYLDEISYWLLN